MAADIHFRPPEVYNWPIWELLQTDTMEDQEFEKRIFTAMEWYNRSNQKRIGEDLSLVNLSIAFEALFALEGSALTEKFKEFIVGLLGKIPQLDSWATQFYNARSRIVHQGSWEHLMFYATDAGTYKKIVESSKTSEKNKPSAHPYRSLTSYGQRIFRLSLLTMLSGNIVAHETGLHSLLRSAENRLTDMLEILGNKSLSPAEKLAAISSRDIEELEDTSTFSESPALPKIIIAAGTRLLSAYLETNPIISNESKAQMKLIVDLKKGTDEDKYIKDCVQAFQQLNEILSEYELGSPARILEDRSLYLVKKYTNYVAEKAF